jgi:hypothetical protein
MLIKGLRVLKIATVMYDELVCMRNYFVNAIHIYTRKYMHAETLALLTKPLYFPNMKYLK